MKFKDPAFIFCCVVNTAAITITSVSLARSVSSSKATVKQPEVKQTNG